MSISLSIYDVFANLIPGLLYFFAINEFIKSIGGNGLDISAFPNPGSTIGVLAIAYLLGHLFNALTYNKWYLLYYERRSIHTPKNEDMGTDNGRALKSLRFQYPDHEFNNFKPVDTDLLFNAIRVRNKELAERIEVNRVNAIMMRNVSFGLFILGLVEIINTARGLNLLYGLAAIVCFIASRLALAQTSKYYHWFYKDVFQAGSLFGKSLKEVVKNTRSG